MGKIFTWQDVAKRRIPARASFTTASALIRRELKAAPSILTALLFGSVVRGDFNERSDIDCLVIYETGWEDDAMGLMQSIDRRASRSCVSINFTPCDTHLAQTGFHQLGPAFVKHLAAAVEAGGLIKGPPVAEYLVHRLTPSAEIESYLRAKMFSLAESMAKSATFTEEQHASFLKKSLEAATHVARKMLIYFDHPHGDSKRDVREAYLRLFPRQLGDRYESLLAADHWYTRMLILSLKDPSREAYAECLSRLTVRAKLIVPFIRENLAYIARTPRP